MQPILERKTSQVALLRTLLLAILIALPAVLTQTAFADEKPATPDEPSAAAMEFVGQFSDDHLTGMLTRIGARQGPLIAMSQLHGQLLAAVYDAEVAKAVKKHGPTWQRNMARAWTALLSEDELTSLRTDGAKSPYTEKYKGLRAEAGQRMQLLSQKFFADVLQEVMQKTVAELSQPLPDADAGKDKSGEKSE